MNASAGRLWFCLKQPTRHFSKKEARLLLARRAFSMLSKVGVPWGKSRRSCSDAIILSASPEGTIENNNTCALWQMGVCENNYFCPIHTVVVLNQPVHSIMCQLINANYWVITIEFLPFQVSTDGREDKCIIAAFTYVYDNYTPKKRFGHVRYRHLQACGCILGIHRCSNIKHTNVWLTI